MRTLRAVWRLLGAPLVLDADALRPEAVQAALESAALAGGGTVQPGSGATELFITPGFAFRAVDVLLTNFHLPQSTLLMLVSAFAGRERVLAAYAEAIREEYRFYSYGDAMLLERG